MKKLSVMLLAVLFTACTSTPKTNPVVTACSDNRTMMCTKELRPACGYNEKGQKFKTYSNSCMACADAKILGYTPGKCY